MAAALAGKYEHLRDEGQLEHYKAIGLPDDHAKALLNEGLSFELAVNGNDIIITRPNGQVQKYVVGQETTEKGRDGKPVKHSASVNGNVLSVTTKGDGQEWTRTLSLSGSELTVVSVTAQPGIREGKRIYKKL